MQKAAPRDGFRSKSASLSLLDFAFFVLDVLTHNRVVLVDRHFLSHRTCVFLGQELRRILLVVGFAMVVSPSSGQPPLKARDTRKF